MHSKDRERKGKERKGSALRQKGVGDSSSEAVLVCSSSIGYRNFHRRLAGN